MEDYGLRVFRHGIVVHCDGRRRRKLAGSVWFEPPLKRAGSCKRKIRAFSEHSRRSLEFTAANVVGDFRTMVTLTYHAQVERWEDDLERNHRIAKQCKADLNRFLSCTRRELDGYLWVQEYQARGVVHFHLLCQGSPGAERMALTWCRAIGALDDPHAVRHGVQVRAVDDQKAARKYLGIYLGKARQKQLPPGVDGSGRWWGRSRSLELEELETVFAGEAGATTASREGVRIRRAVCRYLSKVLRRRFRGGRFISWGDNLTSRVANVVRGLKAFYGTPVPTVGGISRDVLQRLAEGWDIVRESCGEEVRDGRELSSTAVHRAAA